jgi:hypothetical protein
VMAVIAVTVAVAIRPGVTASEAHEASKYCIVLSVRGRWSRRRGCRRALRTEGAGRRYAALAERQRPGTAGYGGRGARPARRRSGPWCSGRPGHAR